MKQHDQSKEKASTSKLELAGAPSDDRTSDRGARIDLSSRRFADANTAAPSGDGQGQGLKLTQGFVDQQIDIILDALIEKQLKWKHRLPMNTENVRVLQERYIRWWGGVARRRPLSRYGLPNNIDALVGLHTRLANVIRHLPDVNPPVEPALHAAFTALMDEVRAAAHRKIEQAARDLEQPRPRPEDEFEPEP